MGLITIITHLVCDRRGQSERKCGKKQVMWECVVYTKYCVRGSPSDQPTATFNAPPHHLRFCVVPPHKYRLIIPDNNNLVLLIRPLTIRTCKAEAPSPHRRLTTEAFLRLVCVRCAATPAATRTRTCSSPWLNEYLFSGHWTSFQTYIETGCV